MLTTNHDLNVVNSGRKNRRNEEVMRPEIIVSCNERKQGIDISDQMASYFTPLRKTIRWYHKIGLKFLLNTAVINVLIIYQEIRSNTKIQISKFRHDFIYSLAKMVKPELRSSGRRTPQTLLDRLCAASAVSHRLDKYLERDNKNGLQRKRCSSCYSEIKKSNTRK